MQMKSNPHNVIGMILKLYQVFKALLHASSSIILQVAFQTRHYLSIIILIDLAGLGYLSVKTSQTKCGVSLMPNTIPVTF